MVADDDGCCGSDPCKSTHNDWTFSDGLKGGYSTQFGAMILVWGKCLYETPNLAFDYSDVLPLFDIGQKPHPI